MINFEKIAEINPQLEKMHPDPPKAKAPAPKTDPIIYEPLDYDVARGQLLPLLDKFMQVEKEMNALDVDSVESAQQCAELIIRTKKYLKKIDEKRKNIISLPFKFTRYVNGLVKPFSDIGLRVVKSGSSKVGIWNVMREQQRREKEKRAKDEAEKLQEDIDKRAEKLGVEPVKLPTMVMAKKQSPIRIDNGTITTKMVWTWKLTDFEKVPRLYLKIDGKALDDAVKAGIVNIPGVKIYEVPKTSTRVTR